MEELFKTSVIKGLIFSSYGDLGPTPIYVWNKLASEDDVADLNDLPAWLEKIKHPIIETEEYKATIGGIEEEEEGAMMPMGTVGMTIPGAGGVGGFKNHSQKL